MANDFVFSINASGNASEQLNSATRAAESLSEQVDEARKKLSEATEAIRGLSGGLTEATGSESQKNADTMTAYFERLSRLGKDTAQHFGDIVPPLRNVGALSSGLMGSLGRFGLSGAAVLAGGMAVKSLYGNLKQASDSAYSLDVNARNAGMSVSTFSRFAGVFRQLGVSAEQANAETGSLFSKLNDALNTRSPEVTGILNQFGVKLAENSDHTVNLEKSTQNLIDAFGRLNGSSQKVVADALGLSDAQLALLRNIKDLNTSLREPDRLGLTMPDSLNAKLVQSNTNLNRLSAAWDAFTDRLQANVAGGDIATALTEKAVDFLAGVDMTQAQVDELRDYVYSHRETIKDFKPSELMDLDEGKASSGLKRKYEQIFGERDKRLRGNAMMLSDDLAAALSPPSPVAPLPDKNAGGRDITPELRAHFSRLEKQYHLPENTLYGLAMTESSGRADAVGPVTRYGTAKGMFQLIDPTAREFGLYGRDVFDPYKASDAAARKMVGLMKQYNGDLQLSLQAYNWGEGNLNAWRRGQKNMPSERMNYAPKVLGHMNRVDADPVSGGVVRPAGNSIIPSSPSGSGVREALQQAFDENKIRLDISVTSTATGQTTRQTVKGGAVATAMNI
ncbi:transglycosylase SLT domain-containing protein [Escherichia sp. 20412-1]|uniref:transglycosylase SLT domain-containing protein n=1 Tax=Escherichia sp. 20412-1 TaxID=2137853 RepID=UPI000D15A4A1|nr:transglycosylase SLT domain-containing protein [Escherichia sp. 20412-1]PSY65662.1 transglycosylase [Escherichia sp. 20412-1]